MTKSGAAKITAFFSPVDSQAAVKTGDKVSAKRKQPEDECIDKPEPKLVKLTEQLCVLSPNIGTSWYTAMEKEFAKPYFAKLSNYVGQQRSNGVVFPSLDEVWAWTTKNDISDTKVVILGQDPYPTPGNAHGLCFSVKKGVPHPQSLKNIFKELEADIPDFQRPDHGLLDGWAEQGVLLLNAVLTVRRGEANSHKDKGWEMFTDAVINWISTNCSNVVFLLWGGYAQKKASKVNRSKHHILKAAHPSPLSANRGGWFGCRHFSQCNSILKENGKEPINWNHLP